MMVRRTATVNGVHTNGDAPPPSTLAAQIIQNQTRPALGQKKRSDAPTFSELLHEILHNRAATIETDVATNVKLISVVAEAGLVPLADRSPFAQQDDLVSQAIDSLTVIESTIKRQPEVLFTPITQNDPPPLLSLLARLFAVCGKPGCEDLPIGRLLDSTLKTLNTSLDLCKYARTVCKTLENCVAGMSCYQGGLNFTHSSHRNTRLAGIVHRPERRLLGKASCYKEYSEAVAPVREGYSFTSRIANFSHCSLTRIHA